MQTACPKCNESVPTISPIGKKEWELEGKRRIVECPACSKVACNKCMSAGTVLYVFSDGADGVSGAFESANLCFDCRMDMQTALKDKLDSLNVHVSDWMQKRQTATK